VLKIIDSYGCVSSAAIRRAFAQATNSSIREEEDNDASALR
jgi:hypothetical protein